MKVSAKLLDRLLARTVALLAQRAKTDPLITLATEHGLGICESVALVAEEACRELGIPCRRRHGLARSYSGRIVPDHHWVELPGDLVLDAPVPDELMLATAAERGSTFWPANG
jgi:hypothetical protein